MTKLSPLMEQYYNAKQQCQGAVLLFRVGDFYETFGDDAILVARELNITLTSRQKDDMGAKIPLAGVPYHALDAYLARLIKAGYKVAICDQAEDPKLAKGLVKREITRVVTPGTIIEPSMLEDGSNNFLAAAFAQDGTAGLALVDVSTGEFMATELSSERLTSEIAKFRPAECLVKKDSVLDGVRCQVQEDPCFDLEMAYASMEAQFGQGFVEKFGLDGKSLCIRACGAVLSYLHKSHFDALGHITDVKIYSVSDFMVLDDITIRNLELLRNIRDRSRRGTLLEFLNHTRTPMGSRMLSRWIQMPLMSIAEIRRRLDAVEELSSGPVLREALGHELKGASDLERLIGRISCGAGNAKDMVTLKASLERLPAISHVLEGARSQYLTEIRSRLDLGPLQEAIGLIEKSIIDDPPASVHDGGIIRDGFDKELDEVRSMLRDGKGWISKLESSERRRTGIKSLKVGYTNVFGYYLEVSRPNLSLVPEDYIRKQTLANAERFITPELKEVESKVLSAQERAGALEFDLFSQVKSALSARARDIQKRASALGELDVLCSLAEVALEGSFVKPEFNDQGTISLRDSRHPVLDKAMRGGFIPNDVYLDGDKSRLIILTGPNMAGKSTFMRQIALASILAQMGSFVPASNATLSTLDRIFTRVGAYDDLAAGQSTFMVEMTELANILSHATRDSLVLLDEIGRGTSTFDGLAIAWAVSEYLHNTIRSRAVFATHYHQLTQLEHTLPGMKNCSIAVKEEDGTITFLRTVVPGATDKSYGVHVARLAGVPGPVVKRADQILKEIEKETVIEPLGRSGKSRNKSARYTQLIFFDGPGTQNNAQNAEAGKGPDALPLPDPVTEEIRSLDIDSLTPRDCQNRLAKYQRMLRDRDA